MADALRPYAIWIVLSIGVLVTTHFLFLIPAPTPLFLPDWEAGDVLGYFGSILGALAAIGAVVSTLRRESDNRKDDLRRSVKPLLVLSMPRQPYCADGWRKLSIEGRREAIARHIEVDRRIALGTNGGKGSSPEVSHPEKYSEEQLKQIEQELNGNVESQGGLTIFFAPKKRCFYRIDLMNVGRGPAINVSVRIEREGISEKRFEGSVLHSEAIQVPADVSFSIGVFVGNDVPPAERSFLVIGYCDTDGRLYEQRAAFAQYLGDGVTKELDFNIHQQYLGEYNG